MTSRRFHFGDSVKISTLAFFWLFLVGFPFSALPARAAALQYEPVVVELTGTVALEEFFGPPGFGETPKTDAKELYAILVLDAPVSVEGVPGDLIDKTYPDVRRVQLGARGR